MARGGVAERKRELNFRKLKLRKVGRQGEMTSAGRGSHNKKKKTTNFRDRQRNLK